MWKKIWLFVLFLVLFSSVLGSASATYYPPDPLPVLHNPCPALGNGLCTDSSTCTVGQPCADGSTCTQELCRVLVTGDSIALGYTMINGVGDFSNGGMMSVMQNLAAQNGKQPIQFVGRFSGTASPYCPTSAASGYLIATEPSPNGGYAHGIQDFFPTDATAYGAHIIIIHVGVNSIKAGADGLGDMAALSSQQYRALIESIVTANPNALVVLNKIIPLSPHFAQTVTGAYPWIESQQDMLNRLIEQMYWQQRVLWPRNLALVDAEAAIMSTGTGWDTHNYVDWLHPSVTGYGLMGSADYALVGPLLP